MDSTQVLPGDFKANYIELEFTKKSRNLFFFYTKMELNELHKRKETDIPNGLRTCPVPDLEIIQDFISPEEE